MHQDSLISMNITYNDLVLNKKYPILFYWNGENNPIEEIVKDEKIQALLKTKVITENMYENTEIDYVTYIFDGKKDIYEEKRFNIKDWYSLDYVSESIKETIIYDILNNVYFKVFNEYFETQLLDNFKDKINGIIAAIRAHYAKEISNETIINYVRKTYKDKSINYKQETKEKNEDIIVRTLEEAIS